MNKPVQLFKQPLPQPRYLASTVLAKVLIASCLMLTLSTPLHAQSLNSGSTTPVPIGLGDADGTSSRIELPRVNINSADAEQLSSMVSGIGPAKARAIVSYREQHGEFQTVDDILKVPGIGEITLSRIRPFLSTTDVEGNADSSSDPHNSDS